MYKLGKTNKSEIDTDSKAREKVLKDAEASVAEIEGQIKAAEEIAETRLPLMDQMRNNWEDITLKNDLGGWVVRILLGILVFFSLNAIIQYGYVVDIANNAFENPLESFIGLIGIDFKQVYLISVVISIIWIFSVPFGSALGIVFIWMSIAGLNLLFYTIAAVLMLAGLFTNRTISAFLLSLPAFTIVLTEKYISDLFECKIFKDINPTFSLFADKILCCNLGLLLIVFITYATVRLADKSFNYLALPVFATLGFCSGMFGKLYLDDINLMDNKSTYWKCILEGNGVTDQFMNDSLEALIGPALVVQAVFLAVAIIFIMLLKLKLKNKKIQPDIRDAVAFVILAILLIVAGVAVNKYVVPEFGLKGFRYFKVWEILIQVLIAYIITRPIATRTVFGSGSAFAVQDKKFVFISYAHADLELIKPYLRMLDREGYEFWYDDSIRAGTEWQGVIANNLAQCSFFLAFISKNSVQSDYCLKEINYATSKNKPLGVIMLDDVLLPPVLEMHLASLQAVQRKKYQNDEECLSEILNNDDIEKCKAQDRSRTK